MELKDSHIKAINRIIPEKDRQKFIDDAIEKALADHKAVNAETVEIFVDGGSRGNPGPAGAGFAVYRGGKLILKGAEFFGHQTNNQAEYLALRLALREVYGAFSDLKVRCFMDSQLVVEQMNGNYKVKSENVRPLYEEVKRIADQFKEFTLSHIPREQNSLADKLANTAMDRG